jgi:putative glycosyltransferase (TIGR04372 family)
MDGRFGAALLWAFWNLSLHEYADFIKKVLIKLEERETKSPPKGPRLLPEFTTNMGHLGYLVSYLGYYENQEPAREIVLWPDHAPNNFYMNLVINQSPIKITTRSGKPNLTFENPNVMDSLIFSRKSSGKWRFEHNAAVCSNQIFPELSGTSIFKLSFPKERENECIIQLEKLGFNPNKWFVILHIRESGRNNLDSTQARDSEVIKFIDFCNLISDLGGQVVRMGGRNFPKLAPNFQAIDYAHSDFSSDMIDCWLWANCRWWTGNANGAALAAHAFGAPRVVVDQWFWDNFGPSTDLYLPKIVLQNGVPLSALATINHKLSRNMNMKTIKRNSLSFRSNTSQEIVAATLDMHNQLDSSQVKKSSQISELDLTLAKLLRNLDPAQTMRVAPSFRERLSNLT